MCVSSGLPAYTYVRMKNRNEPFNLKCGACSIGSPPSLPPEVEHPNIQLGGGNLPLVPTTQHLNTQHGGNLHLVPTTEHLNTQHGGGNLDLVPTTQHLLPTRPRDLLGATKSSLPHQLFTSSPMEPGGPLDSELGVPMIISPIEVGVISKGN